MSVSKQERPDSLASQRPCQLCLDKIEHIDYKDSQKLSRFLSEQGKILPRSASGNCAEHQKLITLAIKRSRQIGLMLS